VLGAVKKLWKIDAPSKALVFGWRFMLNNLPTRTALLLHRGILPTSYEWPCLFCLQNEENRDHLFFSCPLGRGIWAAVYDWIGKSIPEGAVGWNHFLLFGDLIMLSKGGGRVSRLIWLATTWNIWRHRNNMIFNGGTPDASTLLKDVKCTSWFWFSCRYGRNSSVSFSYWCIDPLGCLKSIL
jgi:hypothetical protein